MMSSLGLKNKRNSFLLTFVFFSLITQFWKMALPSNDEEKLYIYIMLSDQAKEVGTSFGEWFFSWIFKVPKDWHQNTAMKRCLVKWYAIELGL